jgi:outer membrane protein OmpA-like peptidoglycan-associated protein
MRIALPAAVMAALLMFAPVNTLASGARINKDHDFIPRFHNVIFLCDVSDSMTSPYPRDGDLTRLFVASRAFALFNRVMPHVPLWQYDLNSGLVTFGDCSVPNLVSAVSAWDRLKYEPLYPMLRKEGTGPGRTAGFQEGLQLAGQLIGGLDGRTAIVVFTDGGSMGECPQKTAAALKDRYGDRVQVYGVYFGSYEAGWRNLYEVCKLTGGYARAWEEVAECNLMKDFAWDILVREIMFPYPEIFFQSKKADLLPSEALKLESVANFLHAIPQYTLQIDGHTTFLGNTKENYELGMARARNVQRALVAMYKVDPRRILIRSWGEELPRYDNQNPEVRQGNREAVLYLMLPLRNFPYDEKNLYTFGVKAVGDIYNTQDRNGDTEYAWPAKPPPGSPPMGRRR